MLWKQPCFRLPVICDDQNFCHFLHFCGTIIIMNREPQLIKNRHCHEKKRGIASSAMPLQQSLLSRIPRLRSSASPLSMSSITYLPPLFSNTRNFTPSPTYFTRNFGASTGNTNDKRRVSMILCHINLLPSYCSIHTTSNHSSKENDRVFRENHEMPKYVA